MRYGAAACLRCGEIFIDHIIANLCLSLWLIGTVRAEPETVISRAWVQSADPSE